ncbi:hypothetical protein IF2G_02256 [Cordyceps javanica]|nr:hypothetical protein IF2G_02256 [Cordyceps javanica]
MLDKYGASKPRAPCQCEAGLLHKTRGDLFGAARTWDFLRNIGQRASRVKQTKMLIAIDHGLLPRLGERFAVVAFSSRVVGNLDFPTDRASRGVR